MDSNDDICSDIAKPGGVSKKAKSKEKGARVLRCLPCGKCDDSSDDSDHEGFVLEVTEKQQLVNEAVQSNKERIQPNAPYIGNAPENQSGQQPFKSSLTSIYHNITAGIVTTDHSQVTVINNYYDVEYPKIARKTTFLPEADMIPDRQQPVTDSLLGKGNPELITIDESSEDTASIASASSHRYSTSNTSDQPDPHTSTQAMIATEPIAVPIVNAFLAPFSDTSQQSIETGNSQVDIYTDSGESGRVTENPSPPPGMVCIDHDNSVYANTGEPLSTGKKVYKGLKFERTSRYGIKPISVAVKILDIIDTSPDKDWPSKFRKEAEQLLDLHHNNIAQIRAHGEVHREEQNTFPKLYIATNMCHAKTLENINIKKLEYLECQNLFLQICVGLEYIHGKSIAHRDLKPSNVLFSFDGYAVIADFGISKNVESDSRKPETTSSNKYCGTHGWVACEVIKYHEALSNNYLEDRESSTKPDSFKADIFALGLLGHFVFCDKVHPFGDKEPKPPSYKLHSNISEGQEPELKSLTSKVGHDALNLFSKMVKHDPEARPDITEVLRHHMFWSSEDTTSFFHVVYDNYFNNKKFRQNASREQNLAFSEVSSMHDTDPSKPDTSGRIATESSSVPSINPNGNTIRQTTEPTTTSNFAATNVSDDTTSYASTSSPEEFFGFDYGLDEQESSESDVQESYDEISARKNKIYSEMRNIMSGSWLDRVKEVDKKKLFYKKNDRNKFQQNSLKELVEYARNKFIHIPSDKREMVKFWAEAFPDLIPYLRKIMGPSFDPQESEKYLGKARSGGINVSLLLVA